MSSQKEADHRVTDYWEKVEGVMNQVEVRGVAALEEGKISDYLDWVMEQQATLIADHPFAVIQNVQSLITYIKIYRSLTSQEKAVIADNSNKILLMIKLINKEARVLGQARDFLEQARQDYSSNERIDSETRRKGLLVLQLFQDALLGVELFFNRQYLLPELRLIKARANNQDQMRAIAAVISDLENVSPHSEPGWEGNRGGGAGEGYRYQSPGSRPGSSNRDPFEGYASEGGYRWSTGRQDSSSGGGSRSKKYHGTDPGLAGEMPPRAKGKKDPFGPGGEFSGSGVVVDRSSQFPRGSYPENHPYTYPDLSVCFIGLLVTALLCCVTASGDYLLRQRGSSLWNEVQKMLSGSNSPTTTPAPEEFLSEEQRPGELVYTPGVDDGPKDTPSQRLGEGPAAPESSPSQPVFLAYIELTDSSQSKQADYFRGFLSQLLALAEKAGFPVSDDNPDQYSVNFFTDGDGDISAMTVLGPSGEKVIVFDIEPRQHSVGEIGGEEGNQMRRVAVTARRPGREQADATQLSVGE